MSSPNICTLPPELQLSIHSFLTHSDSVALGLCCKKLYANRSREPPLKFPVNGFWKMLSLDSVDDFALQHQMQSQWYMRLDGLPRLRLWTERVMGDTAMRALQDEDATIIDHPVTWDICVGCACYNIETDDWKAGWDFQKVMFRTYELVGLRVGYVVPLLPNGKIL